VRGNSAAHLEAFFSGLSGVLPCELLPLWSPGELEELLVGKRSVSLRDLQSICTLSGELSDGVPLSHEAPPVSWLWQVLGSWSDSERSAFLRFVSARVRLPPSLEELRGCLLIEANPGARLDALPRSKTCFFKLELGAYSSKEALEKAFATACTECGSMENM